MSVIKTHKGAELNLEHYKGKSIVDFEFEMLDDEDEALDLTVYSNIFLKIYAKRGGTEIDSFDYNSGLTVVSNIISWDVDKVRMDLYRIGLTYYHHCYGVLDIAGNELVSREDLLFYGNSPVR